MTMTVVRLKARSAQVAGSGTVVKVSAVPVSPKVPLVTPPANPV